MTTTQIPIKRIVLVHGAAHGAWCCEDVTPCKTREMASDHSPFYSDPEGLAAILDEEAQFA